MYNDIIRGPLANTLALHYFDKGDSDPKGWFYFVEQWMLHHGLTPTKMCGKSERNITFSRGKKNLEKEDLSILQSHDLWIAALQPVERVSSDVFTSIMSAHFSPRNDLKESTCFLCWDDQVVPWEIPYIQKLIKDLHQFLKPQYGYAFQREFKKGPSMYQLGVIMGLPYNDETKKERQQVTNWGNVGLGATHSKYKPHMIRDVYPLNFLSPQHLDAKIFSQTLKQWILADATRGTLEELLPNFWSWSVDPSHIDKVKKDLIPHHILIAHMDF